MAGLLEFFADEQARKDMLANLRNMAQSASNTIAGNIAGPVDIASWGLNRLGVPVGDAPVGGSEWARRQGLLGDVKPGASAFVGETLGLLSPILAAEKAPQIAGGLLRMADNASAPRQLNPHAGVIRVVSDYPVKRGLPQDVKDAVAPGPFKNWDMPKSERYDVAGGVYEDMNLRIRPMKDGTYLADYSPPWLGRSKAFYAIGDTPDELIDYGLKRLNRSQSSITSAEKAKYNKTVEGMLGKAGFSPNDFQYANSTQSSSKYMTHIPTGTKIRISNHDLPLHYEQPDLDLRDFEKTDEMVKKIIAKIGG